MRLRSEMKRELKKKINGLLKLDLPIFDRLIHNSQVFMLGGESYRLKQKPSNVGSRTHG